MGNKPIYGNVGIVGFDECDNLLLYIPIFLRIFIRFIINVRHYLILLFKITSTKNKNMSLHFSLFMVLSMPEVPASIVQDNKIVLWQAKIFKVPIEVTVPFDVNTYNTTF